MKRSNLTIKFKPSIVGAFMKSFRANYKRDNEKQFNGNVMLYCTLGVIQRKRVPDIDDCITLIKLGNENCSDEQANDILDRWLSDDENKQRGIAGAFADLCNDFCLDLPFNTECTEAIKNIENTINESSKAMIQLNEMLTNLSKLGELTNKEKVEEKEVISDNKETNK